MESLWPVYGLEYSPEQLNLDAIFGRTAQRVLEIGFGNGETLVEQAANHPGRDYIGIEVHVPGVGHCLLHAEKSELQNLRLIGHDAIDVLRQQIPAASLARVNLYFPDPWPKKRHARRRLIQSGFMRALALRLVPGGVVNIATDHVAYAEQIDEVLRAEPLLENRYAPDRFRPDVSGRSPTAYEREWRAEGRRLHFFCYGRPDARVE